MVGRAAPALKNQFPILQTNQTGDQAELIGLPRAEHPDYCPLTALETWLDVAGITTGPFVISNYPSHLTPIIIGGDHEPESSGAVRSD